MTIIDYDLHTEAIAALRRVPASLSNGRLNEVRNEKFRSVSNLDESVQCMCSTLMHDTSSGLFNSSGLCTQICTGLFSYQYLHWSCEVLRRGNPRRTTGVRLKLELKSIDRRACMHLGLGRALQVQHACPCGFTPPPRNRIVTAGCRCRC